MDISSVKYQKVVYPHPLLPLYIYRKETANNPRVGVWHTHPEVEVLVILQGRFDCWVNQTVYPLRENDVMIVGSGELHRGYRHEQEMFSAIVFHLKPESFLDPLMLEYAPYLLETFQPLSRINAIWENLPHVKETVRRIVLDIHWEFMNKEAGYPAAVSLLVKQFLLTLARNDPGRIEDGAKEKRLLQLKPAIDYVNVHLHDKITVKAACRLVNMSYHYFCKYFAQTLGISFIDYVNSVRIKQAAKLLLTEDWPVSSIGEAVGLPNMSHFYDLFQRAHACSPLQFRKKYVDDSIDAPRDRL